MVLVEFQALAVFRVLMMKRRIWSSIWKRTCIDYKYCLKSLRTKVKRTLPTARCRHSSLHLGNTDKVRQVQLVQQQIIQFVNNPTYETLANAKHFRDMLDRLQVQTIILLLCSLTIPYVICRLEHSQWIHLHSKQICSLNVKRQRVSSSHVITKNASMWSNDISSHWATSSTASLISKASRSSSSVRWLRECHLVASSRMMRLDSDDHCGTVKVRSFHRSSLLSAVNDELNQLPNDVYVIECTPISRTRKTTDQDQEYLSKHSVVLRCKLLERSHPMIPPLRLHVTTSYPEQPPEVLSLTKTMPPRLEFTGRTIRRSTCRCTNALIFRWTFVLWSNLVDLCFASLQAPCATYSHWYS